MKVALILLAAGNSRRFKGNKLLYSFQGKPMYRYISDQIRDLRAPLFSEKIAVTQYQEIAERLDQEGYLVVRNPHSEEGISSSIHLAVEYADPNAALCFAVCDQPYLKVATLQSFVEEYLKSGKGIGCLSNCGELGNPAIFSPVYRGDLLALTGDVGGRTIIRRYTSDLYLHEVEDGIELLDMDEMP